MKLFHAADIHLDSPMRGLAAYDGAPVDDLRLATRRALRNLVDAAIDEQADWPAPAFRSTTSERVVDVVPVT
jgi:DNA repair protein SbcD/Mre11